jgi:hypothetical protein
LLAGSAAAAGILLLPAARALRGCRPVSAQGIETLDDAVASCWLSGLGGWDLVLHAQHLVNRKFTHYSCRNLWDSPARSFRRGMGYCTQYNLALRLVLERLGFDVWPVFSFKVRVEDNPDWSMGHTWLRVRLGGEVRDVCAGSAGNLPGKVNFVPVLPVLPGGRGTLFMSHLGMILFCGALEWRSLLTRRPTPGWMMEAMPRAVPDRPA